MSAKKIKRVRIVVEVDAIEGKWTRKQFDEAIELAVIENDLLVLSEFGNVVFLATEEVGDINMIKS